MAITNPAIEERRKQIQEELEEIRNTKTEDPAERAELFNRMNVLMRELYEIDPPALTQK
jgi:hypothetical protein